MSDVSVFLLCVSAIFLIGIVGELVFAKTGVPDVIWLIVVGIVLGPISGLVPRPMLEGIAPYFGALTLVIVLFNGGSSLQLRELSAAAGRGSSLAVLSFLLAVACIAPITMAGKWIGVLPAEWTWLHGVMAGTILGGSSSVVIMPALAKAGLSARISNIVNLESALTDVLCVVGTGALISILAPEGTGEATAGSAGMSLLKSFGIGVGVGLVAGLVAVLLLRPLHGSSYAYPLMLGALLVLYVIVDELGGSAALAILTAAVMMGNAPTLSKSIGLAKVAVLDTNVKGTHGELTFIIKSLFFVFIGAMLAPPWGPLIFGLAVGGVLLAARIPAVVVACAGQSFSKPARGLIAVSLPRGMAAGVLAMMPHQAGVPGTSQLPVIVFAAVLTSILIFAVGFPLMKKRLPAGDLVKPSSPKAPASEPAPLAEKLAPVAALAELAGASAEATTVDPSAVPTEIPLVGPASDD
ncbi:MAG: cation:proton antiporter [Myxococcota bacterium]|jgi:cell volume regulation protein A|nr:cation:proton antiporter [Myxococcota bacterium]